jgi:hypothetical protein
VHAYKRASVHEVMTAYMHDERYVISVVLGERERERERERA